MAEVNVTISGRSFSVACQDGEESYLTSAAAMLDAEAARLGPQAGQLSEARVLLMAGLMLADRTASVEDQLREALANQQAPAAVAPAADVTALEAELAQKDAALTAKDAELAAVRQALTRAVEAVEKLAGSDA